MGATIFFLSVIILIAGFFLVLYGFEEDSPGCIITAIVGIILGVCLMSFGLSISTAKTPAQAQTQTKVDPNANEQVIGIVSQVDTDGVWLGPNIKIRNHRENVITHQPNEVGDTIKIF